MTLVGNKCDLPDKDRVVSLEQVQEMAQKLGPNVSVMETSALAEINVNEVIIQILISNYAKFAIKICNFRYLKIL